MIGEIVINVRQFRLISNVHMHKINGAKTVHVIYQTQRWIYRELKIVFEIQFLQFCTNLLLESHLNVRQSSHISEISHKNFLYCMFKMCVAKMH